jgi:hypothetical protein
MRYKVILNDKDDNLDITKLCTKLPLIKNSMLSDNTEFRAEFEFDNKDKWASRDYINSIFRDWFYTKYYISIIEEHSSKSLYKGNIENILENPNGLVTISCKNNLQGTDKELEASYFNYTLTDIAYKIQDDFNLEIDDSTWRLSDSFFNKALFTITASKDNKLKINDMIKQLSETIGLWIFLDVGKVQCYPISFNPLGYALTLQSKDLLNVEIQNSFDKLVNNFNVKYSGKGSIEDEKGDNLGTKSRNTYGNKNKEINGASDNTVIIPNVDIAKLIGNNYLNRYKNIFEIITATITSETSSYLSLMDKVKIGNKYYTIQDMEYDYGMTTCKMILWENING